MSFSVIVNWKFVVALGVAACAVIFGLKMDSEAVERVSIHAIDACKEFAVAGKADN